VVRQRDKVCQFNGCQNTNNLQCAHFRSRRKKATRWDEDNAIALCFGHHQYFHENPREFEEFMRKRLGDRFELLEARARTLARYIDKEAIKLYLKDKIKFLEGSPPQKGERRN